MTRWIGVLALGVWTAQSPLISIQKALASPIERVPSRVPQHLVNGSRDPIVPAAFGRAYVAAATRAGDPVELTVLPDAGHFELVAPTASEWPAVRDLILKMTRR